MRRPAHAENTLARIRRWRNECPQLSLRSTFIVGFPGETAAEFDELLDWLEEAQLDRVGCFKYSPVEGAAANALPDHVAPQLQEERYARFMQRAAAISARRLASRVGQRLRVLVDEVSAPGGATAEAGLGLKAARALRGLGALLDSGSDVEPGVAGIGAGFGSDICAALD